jgi:magnesium chelatase subunit I
MKQPFPFSAIVGQDDMKLAMVLTAIDPSIAGVLVFGERGTGKSTAVRALAGLLPPITAVTACPVNSADVKDCPAWCDISDASVQSIATPVVDLPLGASEDRVTGALDIEKALTKGEKAFQPGLFAQANRGYLYIDEVNLPCRAFRAGWIWQPGRGRIAAAIDGSLWTVGRCPVLRKY